jgi:uncharacterized phage-associated protein
MSLTREREKLFNAIIYFCNNTQKCYKLKLMKLLYYLDFWHFKETGRSVTGLKYNAWEKGPVPVRVYHEITPIKNPDDLKEYLFVEEEILNEITGSKKFVIKPKKEFNSKIFSKREIAILHRVSEIFKDAPGDLMKDATHLKNAPWDKTIKDKGQNAEIDYMLSLDDETNSLTEEMVLDNKKFDKQNRELLDSI